MIVVVTGTGTNVGKTHVAVALARHLAARGTVVAYKPIESGVVDAGEPGGGPGHDEAALAAVSAIAVPAIRLAAPLSPHLAARRAGVRLDPAALHARLDQLAAAWPTLVVELAGGLCTPLDDQLDNAQWLAAASPATRARLRLLVVAPDRLGVIHDVVATLHAAAAHGLEVAAIALSAPAVADASTGTNAAELSTRSLARGRTIVALPRRASVELAVADELARLAAAISISARAG